jgi:threonine dehydrogenase-like Zn-dependent dehydrogenase
VNTELAQQGSQLHARSFRFDDAIRATERARHDVDRALTLVYRDPEAAREQIRDLQVSGDPAQVAMVLRQTPEQFGALRTVETSRAFGLVTAQDDGKARTAAHVVAREWTGLVNAEKEASKLAVEYVRSAEQYFDKLLAQVYRDPAAARHAIDLAYTNAGADETTRTLAQSPDRLGALRTPGTSPEVARLDWQSLATSARTVVEVRHITSSELAKAHVDRAIANLSERKRDVRQAIETAPSVELLERAIGRAVDRLEPSDLTKLRRVLTAPQAAIVFKAHQTMRDIVLGREEGIER